MQSGHQSFVHYLPILTTLLSLVFFAILVRASLVRRSGPHLLWWAAGILAYGLGTALESMITLQGNSVELTKAWYIAGALLGGYPLAQGSVYLLHSRKFAKWSTIATVSLVLFAAVFVVLSPANLAALEPHRPTGKVLEWQWVRLLTPFINLYAFIFLVGGAIVSARRYLKGNKRVRFAGNICIAVGGLLPGIGGSLAKTGRVEALYVLELIGLIFIWIGYSIIAGHKEREVATAPQPAAANICL